MSDTPTFQSNPYASFDPSQWSNPYSLFQNQALPWPSGYVGLPTNAMGQPIAVPQGMTLNSTPQAAPAAPQASNPGQWAVNNAIINGMQPTLRGAPDAGGRGAYQGYDIGAIEAARAANNAAYGTPTYSQQPIPGQPGYSRLVPSVSGSAPGGAGGGGGAGGASPQAMNYNTVLAMLANPGNPTTPGATVPQGPSSPMGPGVLQQFMQNWSPAQSGPGSGFQQGFYKALKGMGY